MLSNGKFIPLELPKKHARVLLDNTRKWRYRCLHGGRNGAKDWSAAGVAVEIAVRQPKRFLCTREIQKTIKDSIHQLLADTIKRLGYDQYLKVTNNGITGRCGSSFMFTGLRDINADNLKSIEGIDVAIIGEAQNLTEKSFNVLDPTIRKPGSEIWIFYNDQSEFDFVYNLTEKNRPENMICEKVNYLDVPKEWLSQEIIDQAERMKEQNSSLYSYIWLGEPGSMGRFFGEFGDHNRETPFMLPDDCEGRIIGSLDHGIAHDTSFGLWYIDAYKGIHRLFSYLNHGGTAEGHAMAIWDAIESFPLAHGTFPTDIYYDPSMDTQTKISERMYQSVLDEYKRVFALKGQSKAVNWIAANNRKIDGCQIMRQCFGIDKGKPRLTYFQGYNQSFESGIKRVMFDENNLEIYAKADGDDAADEARYGIVAAYSFVNRVRQQEQRKSQTEWKFENDLKNKYVESMEPLYA